MISQKNLTFYKGLLPWNSRKYFCLTDNPRKQWVKRSIAGGAEERGLGGESCPALLEELPSSQVRICCFVLVHSNFIYWKSDFPLGLLVKSSCRAILINTVKVHRCSNKARFFCWEFDFPKAPLKPPRVLYINAALLPAGLSWPVKTNQELPSEEKQEKWTQLFPFQQFQSKGVT